MSSKPWDIYVKQLLSDGRVDQYGYPLWVEPELSSASSRDVFLGDVGLLRDGHFIPLCNTMAPADDSKNRNGVPRDFVQVSVMPSSPPLIYGVQGENSSFFWLTGSITAERDDVPVVATTE